MEDEIKEILDYISDRIIPNEKWNKVRDYITNLQEENQRLEENNQNMQIEMSKSWERIDKAIEYINSHKVSDTITFPLMKKEQERDVKNCYEYEFEQIYKKDLLNILKGENND